MLFQRESSAYRDDVCRGVKRIRDGMWVNGEEVSGGSDCNPAEGHLCLEAEGSEIHFRNIRIRELP